MMRTCPHCGTLNRDSATYCNQCGALLTAPASAAQRAGDDPGATLVNVPTPDDPGATQVNVPAAHTTPSGGPRTGLLPPQLLLRERYLILEKLGQGGMAAVYKVKDTAVKRGESLRAIKEMSQGALKEGEHEQAIENFHTEAEMLKALDHKNLPKFYDQFQEEDRYYLVMEYIDGETLEDRLEREGKNLPEGKGLPERDVLDWAEQLCNVLTYLHERRPPIIFRDLKPGNIMLTKQGQVKLIDFGIARIFRSNKAHDTQVLGTPGYAPPEQYGKGQTDPRSDVYALGVTLHQLLTRYDPSSTPFSLPPIHALNPDVSPHVQTAIEQATHLKREERFESISDFHSALFAAGVFVFRSGQRATSVAELVALSRQYAQEAEEHLYAGRFEAWLRTIDERKLAKVAHSIVATRTNHAQGLDEFLQQLDPAGSTAAPGATRPKVATFPVANLQLQPGALDIGPLVAGQAGVASFTIKSAGGISGEVKPMNAWLKVSPTRFSGPSTLIEVNADTSAFTVAQKHQGSIQISGAGEHLIMPVSVEVLGNPKTAVLTGTQARDRNRLLKHSWPPHRQPELVQMGTTALMSFGLALAVLLGVQEAIGFAPLTTLLGGPFFALLLVGWALVAPVGAMIGRWGDSLERRALTSAVCSLAGLGLVALLWANWLQPQVLRGVAHPEALLVVTISVGAIAAALGAAPRISAYVLSFLGALVRRANFFVFVGMLILGGYVGYLLTSGFPAPLRFMEPIAIVLGIILGATLALRLNRYLRRFQTPQTTKP